jgi:hypothetical protein
VPTPREQDHGVICDVNDNTSRFSSGYRCSRYVSRCKAILDVCLCTSALRSWWITLLKILCMLPTPELWHLLSLIACVRTQDLLLAAACLQHHARLQTSSVAEALYGHICSFRMSQRGQPLGRWPCLRQRCALFANVTTCQQLDRLARAHAIYSGRSPCLCSSEHINSGTATPLAREAGSGDQRSAERVQGV